MCVPEQACVYADDGWTDGQKMQRWVDLMCVCVCVCERRCLHACDPVCEDGMIDARSDG